MSDFDKSEQKKTEYVLVEINDINRQNTGGWGDGPNPTKEGISKLEGRIQGEINKRPNMRLVNIIPFSPRGMDGSHTWLHLLFEEREHSLDSIREDIAQIRNNSEKILKNWKDLFREYL